MIDWIDVEDRLPRPKLGKLIHGSSIEALVTIKDTTFDPQDDDDIKSAFPEYYVTAGKLVYLASGGTVWVHLGSERLIEEYGEIVVLWAEMPEVPTHILEVPA